MANKLQSPRQAKLQAYQHADTTCTQWPQVSIVLAYKSQSFLQACTPWQISRHQWQLTSNKRSWTASCRRASKSTLNGRQAETQTDLCGKQDDLLLTASTESAWHILITSPTCRICHCSLLPPCFIATHRQQAQNCYQQALNLLTTALHGHSKQLGPRKHTARHYGMANHGAPCQQRTASGATQWKIEATKDPRRATRSVTRDTTRIMHDPLRTQTAGR